jgi:nitroreductase
MQCWPARWSPRPAIYLFCASAGLGSVFRGALDTRQLGALLKLPEGQFVTYAQSVGYPRI